MQLKTTSSARQQAPCSGNSAQGCCWPMSVANRATLLLKSSRRYGPPTRNSLKELSRSGIKTAGDARPSVVARHAVGKGF